MQNPEIEKILAELWDMRQELDELRQQHIRVLRILATLEPK